MNNVRAKRWLWFVVLYLGGILVIGLVAVLIRWVFLAA